MAKSALEAVSAAMDSVTESETPDTEAEPQEPETPEPEATETETPEGEQSAVESGEAPESGSQEQTPEEKAAAETAAAAKAAKPLDPINDPIPAGVAERTKERFKTLIGMNKDLTARADKAEAEHRELFGAIQATGATPDQFADLLEYARLVNSDNLEDKRTLFNHLKQDLVALAQQIGEPLPGEDSVSAHEDLAAAVQAGQITKELASEIAATRARHAASTKHRETTEARTKEQRELETAVNDGKAALTQLGVKLKAEDPDFDRKREILVPALKPVLQNLPPKQWAAAFEQAYRSLKLPAAPVVPVVPAGTPQPMRANKNPSGNAAGKPKNMHEALWGSKE